MSLELLLTGSLAGGFAAFGFLVVRSALPYCRLAKASLTWPCTSGTVQSITVLRADIPGDGGAELYEGYIRFYYMVDSVVYWGDWKTDGSSTRRGLELANAKYQADSKIVVYYNPSKPKQAVLVPGGVRYGYVPLFVGIGMLVLSLLFIVAFLNFLFV